MRTIKSFSLIKGGTENIKSDMISLIYEYILYLKSIQFGKRKVKLCLLM